MVNHTMQNLSAELILTATLLLISLLFFLTEINKVSVLLSSDY